jgi:hypothetical protein
MSVVDESSGVVLSIKTHDFARRRDTLPHHEVLREKIALTLAMRSDPTTRYALAKTRRRPIF